MPAPSFRKTVIGLTVGIMCLASVASRGSSEPPTIVLGPEEIIYRGAKIDPTAAAAKVVFRLGIRTAQATMSVCTMTAIAKDILLTAAHCHQPGKEHVLLSYDPKTGKPAHIAVSRFLIHPRYQHRTGADGGDESTHDLALVKLARPLAIKEFAQIPDPSYRIPSDSKVNTLGFGMNGLKPNEQEILSRPEVRAIVEEMKTPGLSDEQKQKLLIRLIFVSSENPLLRAESSARLQKMKFAVTPVLNLQSENPLCGGDSGGPTFLKTAGKLIQVGVHSLSQNGANCDKDSEEYLWGIVKGDHLRSWDTYVPFYADWIKQEVDKLRAEKDI